MLDRLYHTAPIPTILHDAIVDYIQTILQNEQIKATQHLLNGQKMRYFTMNKQALEIEKTLEEVKGIAGSFKRKY